MFKEYQSKPIIRTAAKIKDTGILVPIEAGVFAYREGNKTVKFRSYDWPKIGDYIVTTSPDDMYHVDKITFEQRNVVE